MLKSKDFITIVIICCFASITQAQQNLRIQVLVIGGGTGGTAAGIQSARCGATTIIAESSTWLGGMISAAGVSATDGNHNLPSGLWGEFRNKIYKVYGGPKAVETGWVSNTLFEPHVADSIFKSMATAEKNLSILYQYHFIKVIKKGNTITGAVFINAANQKIQIDAKVVIDATELGDVMANAHIPYSLGMEAESITGEKVGINESNNIVQDLTYVAILKDYGPKADCTIVKPNAYYPNEFDGCCTDYYINKNIKAPNVDAKKMLSYGKLPHDKYMINWPLKGNDTYLNIVELNDEQRQMELEKAKQTTLRFVYFIQHQLGFKNLGIARDEFPAEDGLAIIPYYREGRRVKGIVRFTLNNITAPFTYGSPLYRTGVSVGDYPVDQHHKKNPAAPQHLDFYPIPSFNVPLGALMPANTDGIIIAEKGISVSNVANGTTRLQPCVLLTGQAAGALAALSVFENKQPRNIRVRSVQNILLKSGAWIMPYTDVPFNNLYFMSIQKIGATGILRGTGIPYKWANKTWFYPDSTILSAVFAKDIKECTGFNYVFKNKWVTIGDICNYIVAFKKLNNDDSFSKNSFNANWLASGLNNFNEKRFIKRFEIAAFLDKWINPFDSIPVDDKGNFISSKVK